MIKRGKSSANKVSALRPEQWILMVGVSLLLLLVIMALNPDSVEHHPVVNQAPAQGPDAQIAPQAQTVAAMQPFIALKPKPYQGQVERIITRDPGGWGQIHIIVRNQSGSRQEVSLSPKWYLDFQGCTLKVGQQVIGEMFLLKDPSQTNTVLYAKNIIINGVRCRLRTVDGFAIWSDQLQ